MLQFWTYSQSIPAFRVFQGKVISPLLLETAIPQDPSGLTSCRLRPALGFSFPSTSLHCGNAMAPGGWSLCWLEGIRWHSFCTCGHWLLTRSPKSWALAMGTNYRQRGSYGAVEVDAPGFKSSLRHLQGKHLVWWDWEGIPMELQRGGAASRRATVG